MRGVIGEIAATQKSAVQQITEPASRGRHHLIDNSLVTPNKCEPLFCHAPEEIDVLSSKTKFRLEGNVHSSQHASPEKHVAGPRFLPAYLESRAMGRPFEEFALFHPKRDVAFEMRFHGPENRIRAVFDQNFEQTLEPIIGGKFVVVYERDQVASRMF